MAEPNPRISVANYPELLSSLEVGSPIAEDDALLYEARVETSVFDDLLSDKIDIVKGTKGSGKSALYTIFTKYLPKYMLNEKQTVMIKGVEITGDPIFSRFKPQFKQLDEIDFQNFWRVYFLSLINSQFLADSKHSGRIKSAAGEVKAYKQLATQHGFPFLEEKYTLETVVAWALSKIPRPRRIEVKLDPSTGTVTPSVGFEQASTAEPLERVPAFIAELHDAVVAVLKRSGLRVWVMLDRLDEVFPRRSETERIALRALLRTTSSFRTELLRIKIFLRDDIFDSVTETPGGFPALTHIVSRCSDTLRWNRDQILHLIVNRVWTSQQIRHYFKIRKDRTDVDQSYREEVFYRVFPEKIRRGKNQSRTLEWIFRHCEDSNGVVTPRDVIDLIKFAKSNQLDVYKSNPTDMLSLLSPSAIIHGHQEMSIKKKGTYLKAEFDHFWKDIEKFENVRAEHDGRSLRGILGADWERVTKDLRSIGFLRFNAKAKTYSIPFLYRHCLHIRQGRAISGK